MDEYEHQTAIRYYNRYRFASWTYRQLYHLSYQCAHWLYSQGLIKGDKVLVYARNCPEWVVLKLACALSGIILVPVDRASPAAFVGKIASLTDPKLVCIDDKQLNPKAIDLGNLFSLIQSYNPHFGSENPTLIEGDDVLEIMYTSGTTSAPKGAVLTHRNVIANIAAVKRRLIYRMGWHFLSVLPLSHIFEQNLGCISVLDCGGTITYINNAPFTKYLDVIVADRVSHIITVPALLQNLRAKILEVARKENKELAFERLLKLLRCCPFPLRRVLSYPYRRKLGSSLQAFICGGAPLDPATEQFWEDLGIRVTQGYGLTEASPLVSCNSLDNRTLGSVGLPLAQQYLRLADNGEVLIGGENVIREYYKEPELTAHYFDKGWYKTGDVGRFDEKGHLYILGRVKEMILTANGMNVFPGDIEQTLSRLAEGSESVVFEDPERKGALIGALLGSVSEDRLKSIRQAANAELATHQHLSKVVNWMDDSFPKTATLKLKRREVDKRYAEWLAEQKTGIRAKAQVVLHSVLLLIAELIKKEPIPELLKLYLKKDLGYDSLELAKLSLTLEERYSVDIDPLLSDSDATVEQLCEWVDTKKGTKRRHELSTWPWRWAAKSVRALNFWILEHLWFRRKFSVIVDAPLNIAHIDPTKPILFVANHTSHLDTLLLLSTLPPSLKHRTAVAAAADYFFEKKHPVTVFFKRLILPLFPFHRTGQQTQNLEMLSKLIGAGYHILLFPEGTRSRTGEMQPFKSGVGLIVKEFDAQVVPIYIHGAYALWPWTRKRPLSGSLAIRYGEAMCFDKDADPHTITSQLEKAVQDLS